MKWNEKEARGRKGRTIILCRDPPPALPTPPLGKLPSHFTFAYFSFFSIISIVHEAYEQWRVLYSSLGWTSPKNPKNILKILWFLCVFVY